MTSVLGHQQGFFGTGFHPETLILAGLEKAPAHRLVCFRRALKKYVWATAGRCCETKLPFFLVTAASTVGQLPSGFRRCIATICLAWHDRLFFEALTAPRSRRLCEVLDVDLLARSEIFRFASDWTFLPPVPGFEPPEPPARYRYRRYRYHRHHRRRRRGRGGCS